MRQLLVILFTVLLCLSTAAQKQQPRQQGNKATAAKKTTQPAKKTTQQTKKAQPAKKAQQPRQTERQRLEAQRKQVQQQQVAARKRQKELEARVKSELEQVQQLDGEIGNKQLTIDSLRHDIAVLDSSITVLNTELAALQKELDERKERYMQSMRYMYRNRKTQNQMMFVFSAKNFNQMFRRLRFSGEYSTFQKMQAEAVKAKSDEVVQKQQVLTATKDRQSVLLERNRREHTEMEQKQAEQKTLVASLQNEQKTVQQLITQQQKQERELNARIEREIQAEIARAEAEARRRAAEEERRRAAANKKQTGSTAKTKSGQKGGGKTTAPAKAGDFQLPAADRALSGNFEQNKGRLPIPITGAYKIIRGLGLYNVSGTKGVTLESKGVYIQGTAGAQARCVFDGQVSAIVQRGGDYMVIVRHGRYLTVYCNLASVKVTSRQSVKTNQILGNVGDNHVLQFQLRNWTTALDPRQWLSR